MGTIHLLEDYSSAKKRNTTEAKGRQDRMKQRSGSNMYNGKQHQRLAIDRLLSLTRCRTSLGKKRLLRESQPSSEMTNEIDYNWGIRGSDSGGWWIREVKRNRKQEF